MKRFAVVMILLSVSGCANMASKIATLGEDMLDTAPQTDFEVRYPEWGVAPETRSLDAGNRFSQKRPQSYADLQSFLRKNGIDYELLPGDHTMVKLKDTIKFQTGSASVSSNSRYWLDIVGSYLATQPGIDIVIDGHADNTGAPSLNDKLSIQRASEVKKQLVRNQVSMGSIYTRGYGEYVPACSNKTSVGKACNRRVEVRFIVSNIR